MKTQSRFAEEFGFLGAKFVSPSLLKSLSGMVCDGTSKSIEGETHLSYSIMQMTGQIASTTVTPVNHPIKGKAVRQGVREGTEACWAADQLSGRSPESITGQPSSPKSFISTHC